jgi:Putative transposase
MSVLASRLASMLHLLEPCCEDYRYGSRMRTVTLDVDEFLRRFLLHVLPKRFVRVGYFGLLAPRCRTSDLATCRPISSVAPPLSRERPSASNIVASQFTRTRISAPNSIVRSSSREAHFSRIGRLFAIL